MNNTELWAQRIADTVISRLRASSMPFDEWCQAKEGWEQCRFRDDLAKEIEREL